MDYLTLLFIAVSLSADSFVVSISCGLIRNKITFWQATRIGFFLGIFQLIMPFLGWFIGKKIESTLFFNQWIAFALLSLIGGKMIFESLKNSKDENSQKNPLDFKVLIALSLATSMDAFVVGISMAYIRVNLYLACLIIGITTFLFSMLGIFFGKKTGKQFGKKMEIIAGAMLILIGIKILLDNIL